MYQIEKGVPLPEAKTSAKNFKYPLQQMAVGDSFVLPLADYKHQNSAAGSVHQLARRLQMRVAVRKVSETELRVWRVA